MSAQTVPATVELPEGVSLVRGRKVDDAVIGARILSKAGWLKFEWCQDSNTAWIMDMRVKVAYRQQGHGTRLLDAVFRLCKGGAVYPGTVVAEKPAAFGVVRVLQRLRDENNVRLGDVGFDPGAASPRHEEVDMSTYFDVEAYEARQQEARGMAA